TPVNPNNGFHYGLLHAYCLSKRTHILSKACKNDIRLVSDLWCIFGIRAVSRVLAASPRERTVHLDGPRSDLLLREVPQHALPPGDGERSPQRNIALQRCKVRSERILIRLVKQ